MSHDRNAEPGRSLTLGVDLGATNARVGLVSADGNVVRRAALPAEPGQGPEATVGQICQVAVGLMHETGVRAGEVRGVGVGTAGSVDIEQGILRYWPNVPTWRNVPLQRLFSERLDLPCTIENDGNAAALAEHWVGVGRGLSSLVMLTLGTGIGGGIVLDGRLWRGWTGAAGEVGHMSIAPDGPPCSCGGRGCLQAYAGARAVVGRMRAALAAGEPSVLSSSDEELTAELIHRAALAGDQAAERNIRLTGRCLGVGISNLMHLLNPQAVALSGGMTATGDLLMEPLREEVRRRTLEASRRGVRLAFSAVPADAGIIGAARRFVMDLQRQKSS